jgi:hypothetical protein
MSKLSADRMRHRDHIETAQAELIILLRDVDEVILRTRQAIRRTPLVSDVLQPSMDRLAEIKDSLCCVQEHINSAWQDGEKVKWEHR